MYEMMAVALSMNRGRAEDVNTALGYAADLAVKSGQGHDLTRIADTLAIHGLNDRAGELLDQAAAIEPGNPTALLMSMTLAERVRSADRMADAAERLLALGWPGVDETWRRETRRRAEALSEILREEGRDDEARSLLDRLTGAETRDLVIRLTWSGTADLSLIVEEPLGATARVSAPRTVFGGALVKNGFGDDPEEVYVCPRAFDGTYTIRVERIPGDEGGPPSDLTLDIIIKEGMEDEHHETRRLDPNALKPETIPLTGGRRTEVLPYSAPAQVELSIGPDAEPPSAPDRAPRIPDVTPADAADALRLPGAGQPSSPRPR